MDMMYDVEPPDELHEEYYLDDEISVSYDFDPSDAKLFESLLSVTRDGNRKAFTDAIKRKDHTSVLYTIEPSKSVDCRKGPLSKSAQYYKDTGSILKTYHDFLEYKKVSKVKSRVKDVEALGLKPTKKAKEKEKENVEKYHFHSAGAVHEHLHLSTDSDFSKVSSTTDNDSSSAADFSRLSKKATKSESEKLDSKAEYLVQDKYYPGVIDDAVNKKFNYYDLLFNLSFENNKVPDKEPDNMLPTLIEAFDIRCRVERESRKKETITLKGFKSGEDEGVGKNFVEYLRKSDQPEQTTVINRDEIHAANAVEFDLRNIVRNRPANGLIQAINSLFKAEAMNVFDKSQQEAEEAFMRAPPEFAETAAVYRAEMPHQSRKDRKFRGSSARPKTINTYNPIEVISYMGITKPDLSEINPIIEAQYAETKI